VTGQFREAGHVGERSAPDFGLGVGQQPRVGVEADRHPQLIEDGQPQSSRLVVLPADSHDPRDGHPSQ
jgi:hypothetical protein